MLWIYVPCGIVYWSSEPHHSLYRTGFGFALFWCWVSLCVPFTISLLEFYFVMIFIMIVMTIVGIFMANLFILNGTFRLSELRSSGSANAQLPGCFRPCTCPLNIELNMLPSDSLMSCLHSLLGYSTGGSRLCNWLSLWWLVPWMNHYPPGCWSTFWKSSLNDSVFYCFTYSLMPHNVIILYFRLPYIDVWNSALFST